MPKSTETKRFAILCHKLAVYSELQLEVLSEINPTEPDFVELKETIEKLTPMLEKIVNDVFEVHAIRHGTYFQDMMNKVDTVFRKNYQSIEENDFK
jgi:hypothetical protein